MNGLLSLEQEKMSREELRLLCQRVKLIDTYLETLNDKKTAPTSLTNGSSGSTTTPAAAAMMPSLRDALALDIPFDLKQRIANSAKSSALLSTRSPNHHATYQFAFALDRPLISTPPLPPPPPPPSNQLTNNTNSQNGKNKILIKKKVLININLFLLLLKIKFLNRMLVNRDKSCQLPKSKRTLNLYSLLFKY